MRLKLSIEILASLFLLLLTPQPARADTVIPGGTITTNTTWTLSGSPYIVQGSLFISPIATLTIQPGVQVRFTAGSMLTVDGRLIAEGSGLQKVVFTAHLDNPLPGSWAGIRINPGGQASLDTCEINFAGGFPNANGLLIRSSSASVKNCQVNQGSGPGIYLEGVGISPSLQNITLQNNAGPAVQQSGPSMSPRYTNLAFTGNGTNGVVVSGWTTGDGALDGTNMGGDFFVNMTLGIAASDTMTVTAGTTLRFQPGIYFAIYGGLRAQGTTESPIRFTSASANPAPGDWRGLAFYGSSHALLQNCEFSYAGNTNWAAIEIQTTNMMVKDCILQNNKADGVFLKGAGISPILQNISFVSNAGVAVHQFDANMTPQYHNLSAAGEGINAIALSGTVTISQTWDTPTAGLPFLVMYNSAIAPGSRLAITPGTTVKFNAGVALNVSGDMYALGELSQPITLTASTPVPGYWRGILILGTGKAIFSNADFSYGGYANAPMVDFRGNGSILNSRLHHASASAILVNNARPYLAGNRIESNGFGVYNASPQAIIDARFNWWGDPTGPKHPSNPPGLGQPVTDGVLFDPWLQSPDEGLPDQDQLIVSTGGPLRASPGQQIDTAVFFMNPLSQVVSQAVVVLALPQEAQYTGSTGGGIYWPELHQVFWKLGDMDPGEWGMLSVQAVVEWGLPQGTLISQMALISASGLETAEFDVQPYLDYIPLQVLSEVELTPVEVQAERTAYPELDTLYKQALASGFDFGIGRRLSISNGSLYTEIALIHPASGRLALIRRENTDILAEYFTPIEHGLRDSSGGITVTHQTGEVIAWGDWSSLEVSKVSANPNYWKCSRNCIISNLGNYLVGKIIDLNLPVLNTATECIKCNKGDTASCVKCARKVLGYAGLNPLEFLDILEDERELVSNCNKECKNPDNHSKYICKLEKPVYKCWRYPSWVPNRFRENVQWYTKTECNVASGLWISWKPLMCTIALQECVDGYVNPVGGTPCKNKEKCPTTKKKSALNTAFPLQSTSPLASAPCTINGLPVPGCSVAEMEIRTAKDPNEKYGPLGDLLPGQPVTYTVAYENMGQGTAYGVYIIDDISPYLDESTLDIQGDGDYIPATRTIIWNIGTLPPKGQDGASGQVKFTAKLMDGLIAGTVVANQAVVYFPSVPEETPTNVVVNQVQPLAAYPQVITTTVTTAIPITLSGKDANGLPLNYLITQEPLHGIISGAAPNITYTPHENFTGGDQFWFKVKNSSGESRETQVQIFVIPGPGDKQPPEVMWTSPEDQQTDVGFSLVPVYGDADGNVYPPQIIIQFSEALDPVTLTKQSVQIKNNQGQPILVTLGYNPAIHQLQLTLRQPLAAKQVYTVSIANQVTDASGNHLIAPFNFTFTTEGSSYLQYLPVLSK